VAKILEKTKRLYGEDVEPRLWKYMSYNEVLQLKIRLAGEQIDRVNSLHYMSRDANIIRECKDSISLCRALLKELDGTL